MSREYFQRPHSVYRLHDASGALLYIGMTENIKIRLEHHLSATTKAWSAVSGAAEIRANYDHHTLVEYPDWFTAHAAEIAAISDEAPLLNRHHNPKRWRAVFRGGYVPVEQVSA